MNPKSKKSVKILESSRGQAGIEREITLSQGGNAALLWRSGGVKAGFTIDRKKKLSRQACRGRFNG